MARIKDRLLQIMDELSIDDVAAEAIWDQVNLAIEAQCGPLPDGAELDETRNNQKAR